MTMAKRKKKNADISEASLRHFHLHISQFSNIIAGLLGAALNLFDYALRRNIHQLLLKLVVLTLFVSLAIITTSEEGKLTNINDVTSEDFQDELGILKLVQGEHITADQICTAVDNLAQKWDFGFPFTCRDLGTFSIKKWRRLISRAESMDDVLATVKFVSDPRMATIPLLRHSANILYYQIVSFNKGVVRSLFGIVNCLFNHAWDMLQCAVDVSLDTVRRLRELVVTIFYIATLISVVSYNTILMIKTEVMIHETSHHTHKTDKSQYRRAMQTARNDHSYFDKFSCLLSALSTIFIMVEVAMTNKMMEHIQSRSTWADTLGYTKAQDHHLKLLYFTMYTILQARALILYCGSSGARGMSKPTWLAAIPIMLYGSKVHRYEYLSLVLLEEASRVMKGSSPALAFIKWIRNRFQSLSRAMQTLALHEVFGHYSGCKLNRIIEYYDSGTRLFHT